MITKHKIIIGDSRRMKEVPDESVHLIITSPPYWQLKDYGNARQIGFNDTYEEYINNLNLVWNECHRVLHKGCRLCINVGDQFARAVYYGRYKVIPIRTEIIKFCENIGFDYMGALIWQKVTTCKTTGGATVMGSFPYPRNGILKLDYEFILILKKYGNAPKVSKEIKEQSRMTKEEWNQYFTGHWNFPGEKQDKHLAMFPEELPRRLIKMFSFVGDTVLDPFLGSGTTSLAAKNLGRNSIGYEINEDFLPIIEEKVGLNQTNFLQAVSFEIIRQEKLERNFKEEIKKLPYIFNDPVAFDKKVNPKKLRFGSKIDNSPSERETYYTVKEIISPEVLVLNNGLKIRLLGVKEKPEKNRRQKMAIKIIQLGTGGFGRAFRHAITTTEGVEVVALVDINPETLKEGASFYSLPEEACFAPDGAWDAVEADIVIDATPHLIHAENAKRVFQSGKNLIVVKPMSNSWETGLEMVEEAERRGCKMAVAQQLRFHPLIMKVRDIITGGTLGDVGYVHLDAFFGYPGLNRQSWTQPYPLLAECSIHHFDYLRWATGKDAIAVSAEHWNPKWVKEYGTRYAYCLFEMEDGCRVCYRGIATKGDTISWLCRWRVEGEQGILKVENDRVYLNDEEVNVAWEDGRSLSDLNLSALNRVVLHQFIEYLKEDKEPSVSGRNNLNSLHMVFGSIEAAEKGKKIPLWTR